MTLEIALLGAPLVEIDGARLKVDTRKAIALLSYLALTPAPVPRDTLSFLLWPDYPTDRSRAALRRTLSALRTGLGDGSLQADRVQIELPRTDDVDIDIARFEALGESDDLRSLREAGALYRGDFMAGFGLRDSPEFDDWQLAQAAHYRGLASSIFHRLSTGEAEADDYPAAIAAGRRWLELDPLHEPAHRQLMRLHALSGDRAVALQQYRACAGLLEEELGVGPLPETTELYHVIAEGHLEPAREEPMPSPPRTRTSVPRSSLVGREEALALVDSAYDDQQTHALAVIGEGGIGKTRLADEFAAAIEKGQNVVRASANRSEEAVPFGLAIELIRAEISFPDASSRLAKASAAGINEAIRLVPELRELSGDIISPPSIEEPGGQARLFRGASEIISALGVGALIILDDLQWTDAESLSVLAAVVRLGEPALILLLYRSEDLPASHPLPTLVRDESRSRRLDVIELPRLTRDELTTLIEDELPTQRDRADELFRLTEGVPYFAVEYIAALRTGGDWPEALPPGVRDLLEDRIAIRSDLAGQVLGAAAVLERSFDFGTVQAVSGRSEEEVVRGLDELIDHHLIREAEPGDTFDFDHERLLQLVQERTSALRRRRLHSRAADHLLAASRPHAVAASAAFHLEAAGRIPEAAEQHRLAGDHARALHANESALQHFDAALGLGHPDVTFLREGMGDLLALAGRYGEGLDSLQVAASMTEGVDLARIEHKMGVIHASAGEWDHSEVHLMSASERLTDTTELVRLWADWAWVAHRRGNSGQAADLARRSLEDAGTIDDPEALAQAHNMVGIATKATDPAASENHFETALELSAEGDPTVRAAALNNLAMARLAAGDPEAGLALGQEALDIYITVGDRHKEAAVHSNLADLLHAAGQDEEARTHLTEAAELFSEVGLDREALEPEVWKLTEW